MSRNFIFFIGILGVALFAIPAILGGFLIEDYSVLRQYISESYAVDTQYGPYLRILGYIPSGLLLTLFCFATPRHLAPSKAVSIGFGGIAIFYGLATVIVGIFPCDSGCNRALIDPSLSHLIHTLTGGLTYLLVPLFMMLVGIGLKMTKHPNVFGLRSIVLGVIAFLGAFVLLSNPDATYIGLYQRLVEPVFLIWFLACAWFIKQEPSPNNPKS